MEPSSVKYAILKAAEPYLEGLTVKDLVIGISLVACQLSDGSIGVAYVLRNALPPECGAFAFASDVIGMSAHDAAQLFTEGRDDVQRAVGDAVLAAASKGVEGIHDDESNDIFGISPSENDTLGMIGLIGPVARKLEGRAGRLIIFDESLSQYYGAGEVEPMSRQSELLPLCSKVIITGSATVNGSIDGLLQLCSNAEQIVVVGASTPMFPEGWKGTKVTRLAGSHWKSECKDEIFRAISLGGGIAQLKNFVIKKCAEV